MHSLIAHLPFITGYLSYILFCRLAMVFCTSILSQLWFQETTQAKNSFSSSQQVDPSLDGSSSNAQHLSRSSYSINYSQAPDHSTGASKEL